MITPKAEEDLPLPLPGDFRPLLGLHLLHLFFVIFAIGHDGAPED
jgi:hypothetical protein